jgi:phosphoribosylformimino-5-aminoimidazole carboxamide ribotide isomerase
MIILPAIDIKDGKCVRLINGDFDKITKYKKSPLDQSSEFSDLGFKNIHIVDLDGALERKLVNKNIIEKIVKKNNLKIQVGGGIRSLKNIEEWISTGADKVIIGTAAIDDISFLEEACSLYKNKIALALDVRLKLIALSGWKKQTNISALDFAGKIKNFGISRIIYTDINKDGTKTGPNIDDTIDFSEKINIPTIVSGGVASISDIIRIKKVKSPKIEGVIVGKAIYDKSINLKQLSELI